MKTPKLVDSNTGEEILPGTKRRTLRNEIVTILDFRPPESERTSGRVIVKLANGEQQEFFPLVIDAEIRTR
jgi:hypothetical protein